LQCGINFFAFAILSFMHCSRFAEDRLRLCRRCRHSFFSGLVRYL